MNREQLEFLISQYLDGNLPSQEKAALEQMLENDDEARQMLAEYRSLDEMLRTQVPGVPAVNWDRLADHLSNAVADAQRPAVVLRIGWRTGLAIAASVLIALGIATLAIMKMDRGHGAPKFIVQIDGPRAQPATQPAVAEITVGPANEFAESHYPLSDGIIFRPSSVSLIAVHEEPAQDTHRSPYQR